MEDKRSPFIAEDGTTGGLDSGPGKAFWRDRHGIREEI